MITFTWLAKHWRQLQSVQKNITRNFYFDLENMITLQYKGYKIFRPNEYIYLKIFHFSDLSLKYAKENFYDALKCVINAKHVLEMLTTKFMNYFVRWQILFLSTKNMICLFIQNWPGSMSLHHMLHKENIYWYSLKCFLYFNS